MPSPEFPSDELIPAAPATGDRRCVVTAPLCVDCQHYRVLPDSQWVVHQSRHRCAHPSLRDPVTGADACCRRARDSRRGLCGQAGALFAQRLGDGVRPAPTDWPFGELTQEQRLTRAKQEARMRANALRGLPSCFGGLS